MSYGEATGEHDWTLSEQQSRPLIRQALEAGINFFDTANMYSNGSSEEILGRALKDFAHRDEVVIATKTYANWKLAPNAGGLSRKALFHSVDDSLSRLGTDYIDLLQLHRLDRETPMEEIVEALHDIVKSGKVRYVGASTMYAWEFSKMLHIAQGQGFTKFASMQPYYNLLYREEEREMLPLCRDRGIAVLPWSPMARGKLTRDWADESSARAKVDKTQDLLYGATQEADSQVVEAVAKLANERELPRAQVALAWLLHKPGVTAPIFGATKPRHIEDAVAALDVSLSNHEITALEAPYIPHAVTGMFDGWTFDLKVSVKA
jgi:aryl-alcohol dehydrogenase-like predicted oxidoreductase